MTEERQRPPRSEALAGPVRGRQLRDRSPAGLRRRPYSQSPWRATTR